MQRELCHDDSTRVLHANDKHFSVVVESFSFSVVSSITHRRVVVGRRKLAPPPPVPRRLLPRLERRTAWGRALQPAGAPGRRLPVVHGDDGLQRLKEGETRRDGAARGKTM